jgi:nucleotide-binding universal stress UspA family protein
MFKTIVWGTDGSPSADKALPLVRSLAESGGSVFAVHAVEHFLSSYEAGRPVYGDEQEMKAKIERQMAELRSDGLAAETKVVHASGIRPAHLIADAARELEADVIVVGTRGHTPLAGLMLGSVTQRLLHIAPCPVLAVPALEQGARPETAAAGTVGAPG